MLINPHSATMTLFQTAIPFIISPTGSMGNNGAVTLGTALPVIYANAWVYYPAGAISSGSTAGFYLTQFSSTTVGVVYNNQPASGTVPVLPISPLSTPQSATVVYNTVPFVTTGPGAYTGATTIQTMATLTLPNGVMGPNGSVRINALWECNNSAGAKTTTVTFGGTSVQSVALTTSTDFTNQIVVRNRGLQNVQVIRLNTSTSPYGTGTTAPTQAAIDTSASVNIVFQGTIAVATDFLILSGFAIEVLQGA